MDGQNNTDLDATEQATAYKLDKARERGSIFRSTELTFAVVLLTCVACLYGLGKRVGEGIAVLIQRGLSFASRDDMTQESALSYAAALVSQAVTVLAPAMFAVWVAALLAAAIQARGVFSAQPLAPDFTRLNPANGFKRVFSMKSLNDL
jgi:flagellar biosynthesis protein FlhB